MGSDIQIYQRCLFLTGEYFHQSGGGTFIRGLIDIFADVFGENNFYICSLNSCHREIKQNNILFLSGNFSYKDKFQNIISTGCTQLDNNYLAKLKKFINEKNIEILILGRTHYGSLAHKLKRECEIKIISICHDVAFEYLKENIRGHSFENLPRILWSCIQEYMAVKFSDKVIVLNEREKRLYIESYNKVPDAVIPIFCTDIFDSQKIQHKGVKCNLLFVGADYWPNIDGIIWFIQNVMIRLDNRFVLYVIGRNIDKIKGMLSQSYDNVIILGTVDSVDSYYYDSDIVVGPIFFGSGMKTKTVEALMFGKTYLGTKEALEGYIGMEDYLCNTADEFIDKIYSFYEREGELRFNQYSRSLFEKYYSKETIKKQIYSMLQ